jgi:hypothetical protein
MRVEKRTVGTGRTGWVRVTDSTFESEGTHRDRFEAAVWTPAWHSGQVAESDTDWWWW